MKITAAVARGKSQPFTIEELELDEPREDEVIVRMVSAGVCHTDLSVRDGFFPTPLPAVLGHEGAGVVECVGSRVTKVQPGDHVIISFVGCGECLNCRRGRMGYCTFLSDLNFAAVRPDGSVCLHKDGEPIHGPFFSQSSFATHALSFERGLIKVSNDVPLEILGPLGCGVMTGAGAVINAFKPSAGSSIAIFGTGSVGLSAIMAARIVGCTTIIGVDVRPQRLALAQELGATHVINGSEGNTLEQIRDLTGGGVDYSLEATGIPRILRQAVDCLRLTGTCGIVGAPPLDTEVSLDVHNLIWGRTVRGIIMGDATPDIFIPQLIELYKQGRLPFDKLIKNYNLEDINTAAADSAAGNVLKPVLVFS